MPSDDDARGRADVTATPDGGPRQPHRRDGKRVAASSDPSAPHGELLLAFAGYLVAIFVSALTAGTVAGVTGDLDGVAALLAGQVGFWAILIGTVVVAVRRHGIPAFEDRALRLRWIDVPVGLGIGAATQLVLLPALYLPFRSLIDLDELSGPARDLFDGLGGAGLIAMAIGVIVVAPIVEELFFRGLLLQAMRLRWGPALAIAGSSAVFGVTHFQPLQFPALALAGAVFAAAMVRTGRLATAITVHASFNATTFVALMLAR